MLNKSIISLEYQDVIVSCDDDDDGSDNDNEKPILMSSISFMGQTWDELLDKQ